MTYLTVKRMGDVFLALFLLIVTLPLQGAVAILVRRRLGSPILFRQIRPGKDGKPFTLFKFRTMLDMDPETGLISDASRMTDFGRLLRSTSLDELPALWNVVRGEMSMVGPRPLLMRYLPLYSDEQSRRHEVLPGLTGLAQVSGRNALSWDDKFRLDVEYVNHLSLCLDFKILVGTVVTVIRRNGISAVGDVTMPEFRGTEEGSTTPGSDG